MAINTALLDTGLMDYTSQGIATKGLCSVSLGFYEGHVGQTNFVLPKPGPISGLHKATSHVLQNS